MTNKLFNENLEKFVFVYLDDFVVFSKTLENHVEHLQEVFKIMRTNTIREKRECTGVDPVHWPSY